MILEGIMEIFLGIFFSETLFLIFTEFPLAMLGAMMMYTAFLLGRIAFKDFNMKRFPIILIWGLCCFFLNITVGFFIGLGLFLIFKKLIEPDEN